MSSTPRLRRLGDPANRGWCRSLDVPADELRDRLDASGDWRRVSTIDGTVTYQWAGTKKATPAIAVGRSAVLLLASGRSVKPDELVGARLATLRLWSFNVGHPVDTEAIDSVAEILGIDPLSGRPVIKEH